MISDMRGGDELVFNIDGPPNLKHNVDFVNIELVYYKRLIVIPKNLHKKKEIEK